MIKLVLTDMDNTLIPFGAERVSPRAMDAIRELRAAGVEFGPATGRDTQELMRFFGGDDSAFQTGILSAASSWRSTPSRAAKSRRAMSSLT